MTDAQVPEEKKVEAAAGAAVVDAGAATAVAGAEGDAQQLEQKLKADFEKREADLTAKYEADLNKLRSSLDKGKASLEERLTAAQERLAAIEREKDELEVKGMDDAQIAQHRARKAEERAAQLEERLKQAEQARADQETFQQTVNYFRKEGIPDSALDFENGIEGLSASAWKYLSDKAKGVQPEKKAEAKKKGEAAPEVLTGGEATPARKKTKADVIKEIALPNEHPEATERRLYAGIASGEFPPNILPLGN